MKNLFFAAIVFAVALVPFSHADVQAANTCISGGGVCLPAGNNCASGWIENPGESCPNSGDKCCVQGTALTTDGGSPGKTSEKTGGAAGLVPCGNGSDYADRCTLCHLVVGFDKLIDYGFNILIFVALAALLAAGVLYVISAGDQGMITTAKGIMKNTLFGFAFVLLGWLLVNFTLYVLGGKDSNKDGIPDLGFAQDGDGRWDQFQCISDTSQLTSSSKTTAETATNKTSTSTAKSSNAKEGEVCGTNDKGICMSSCPTGYGSWSGGTSCGSSTKCCVAQNVDVGGGCTDGHNAKSGTCRSGSSSLSCPSGEVSTSRTSTHCAISHGSGEARCCTALRDEGCKSMAEGETWVGQCFPGDCSSGWAEKSGVNVILGSGCDSGDTCCLRN